MIQNEREIRHELVLQAARRMMTAARTAPKGKGIDIIEIAMVTDGDILRLSDEMIQIAAETGFKFLLRDAENIKSADAVVIIGTSQKVQGLNCAHCGFDTCVEKPDLVPCAINSVDLGIAIGSAAQRLGLLGDCKCVMAIPVSASSKNPFFDRKPKEEPKN